MAYAETAIRPMTGEKPSPFTTASIASTEVETLVSRLRDLADRLCGAEPTANNGAAPSETAAGVFPSLEQAAASIMASVEKGDRLINRIERHLP